MGRTLIETSAGYMHVRTEGSGQTPLVLLHMSPLTGSQFDPIAPLLATDRLVVIPDRIGFGHSDRVSEPLSIVEHARATLDVLDALGIEQFDLFGGHTGSVEAVEMAVSYPDRVRRVAVDGLVIYDAADEQSFRGRYVPPPRPTEDGSHLAWYWSWWAGLRLPDWDAAFMQWRTFDHIDSSPDFWKTYIAVIDHPHREQIPLVTQPFLVLAPRDHLYEQTHAARDILPPQAEFLDLPHLLCDEPVAFASREVAEHLTSFLA